MLVVGGDNLTGALHILHRYHTWLQQNPEWRHFGTG